MSTVDHSRSATVSSAGDIAAQLREADFIRLIAAPDGDALAATGVLARRLETPFQASVDRSAVGKSEADVTVTVGRSGGDVTITDEPLSMRAVAVARALAPGESALDSDPDESGILALAFAGVVAAECDPSAHTDAFDVEAAPIDDRPGIGVPTADLADGLAHTTLVHAPFSGDRAAAAEALSEIDLDSDSDTDVNTSGRAVASMLAFSIVDESKTRASTAIERAIHPTVVEGETRMPFATVAGYADVLDALARSWPGTGLALALGHDCHEAALDGWRGHARAAHAAVRSTDLVRYRGLVVVDVSGMDEDETIGTIARLVRDYRSPEPVVLVIADDAVAATATESGKDITTTLTEALRAVDEDEDEETSATGRGRYGYAQLDNATRKDAFIDAFREAV